MLACIQVKLMTYFYYEDENNSEFTLATKILTSSLTERWVKSNFLKREKLKLKETITSTQKPNLCAYHPIIIKAGFIITSGSLFYQARVPIEI